MYDKVCASCGKTLSEFYNTGMLGCPNCYNAFGTEVLTAIKKVQGATVHKGKTPSVEGLDRELLSEYARLLEDKERAILDARFKDATELSKMIFDLGEELKRRRLL